MVSADTRKKERERKKTHQNKNFLYEPKSQKTSQLNLQNCS
jgi:hypothetical protein